MSVEEIKRGIVALSPAEQGEVTAFLFHLRHTSDFDYQSRVQERLSDRDSEHWLTLEEVERRLDLK